MRTCLGSAALLAILVAACADTPVDSGQELAQRAQLDASEARSRLPIQGSCTGTSTQQISFEAPVLRQVATAVCTVSHLGRIVVVNIQEVNTATGDQLGQATWTTAAGDQLNASSVGTSSTDGAGNLDFSGTTTISGGTGRFDGASGTVAVSGSVVMATGAAEFRYDGWISYAPVQGR